MGEVLSKDSLVRQPWNSLTFLNYGLKFQVAIPVIFGTIKPFKLGEAANVPHFFKSSTSISNSTSSKKVPSYLIISNMTVISQTWGGGIFTTMALVKN